MSTYIRRRKLELLLLVFEANRGDKTVILPVLILVILKVFINETQRQHTSLEVLTAKLLFFRKFF